MKKLFTNAAKALMYMKKQPLDTVVSLVVDFLTIFLFISAFQLYNASVGGRIERILVNLVNPAGQVQSDIVGVVVATVVFYFVLYFIWTLLQSVSWFKAHRLCGLKMSYKKMLKRFAMWSLIWIVVAAVINTLHDVVSVVNTLANELFFRQSFVNGFFIGLAVLFAYFLFISYAHERPFITGVKKANIIIPAYLFIALSMTVIHYLMVFGSMIHPVLNIVMGVVLFLPALTWAKTYLILNIKEV